MNAIIRSTIVQHCSLNCTELPGTSLTSIKGGQVPRQKGWRCMSRGLARHSLASRR